MDKERSPGHRLLTRAEVASIFQVSPSTITRWAEAGKLPVVKTLGGHRRYDAEAIQTLARQLSSEVTQNSETRLADQEVSMSKTIIDVPAMYGDHHVTEVRHILLALPGVQTVTASSCFQVVEVSFESDQTNADQIKAALDQAGYLNPLPIPVETDMAVTQLSEPEREKTFRHTTAFEQARDVVSFAHAVPPQILKHALWPCPGVGPLHGTEMAGNGQQKEVSHA